MSERLQRLLPAALLVGCALAALPAAQAQDREGSFEVRSASSMLVDGVYRVDARVQFVLSDQALEALENGVPLNIQYQFEVVRNRRFWLDATEASLAVGHQLQYHALSQRYIVRNLNTGEQDSYATLFSALNNLGRVEGLPVIDESLLDEDGDYSMRMRAVLDIRDFPAPLRLLLFWRDEWRLESDWFRWPLVP